MFPFPGLGDLISRAISLAERSRASEITVDILLAALDAPDHQTEMRDQWPCSYIVNTDWKSLSAGAAKALAPFAGMETIDRDALRMALLKAQRE